MERQTNYVVGFLFSSDTNRVALIRKSKPRWQNGLLNGVGGKIDPDESPLQAMVREFEEEAGVRITDWRHFCTLRCAHGVIWFYESRKDVDLTYRPEEPVDWFVVREIPLLLILPNLLWLIPLALDPAQPTGTMVEAIALYESDVSPKLP